MKNQTVTPEIGMVISYYSIDYNVVEVTDISVELKRVGAKPFESSLIIARGSNRYCKIFGGTPISIDPDVPDTVLNIPQTKSVLSAMRESEEDAFGSGPIVTLVDKITDEENKTKKAMILTEAIMDFESDVFIGVLLMCNMYVNRKALIALDSDKVKKLSRKIEGIREYDSEVISLVEELYGEDTASDAMVIDIFSKIPEEDASFFAHAISGWEGMDGIGIPNKVVIDITNKAIEEYNETQDEE